MLFEIINLMMELQDDTYKEAVTELRANKSLDARFVEHLIHFTSEERKICIKELTEYEEYWLNREDYEEQLTDDLSQLEEYENMPEEEFEQMIAQRVLETEFVKAIVIYVG